MDMLTGIGLKFSLKIGQNCSKHIYVKTFDLNHLNISTILLQKKTCVFISVSIVDYITEINVIDSQKSLPRWLGWIHVRLMIRRLRVRSRRVGNIL